MRDTCTTNDMDPERQTKCKSFFCIYTFKLYTESCVIMDFYFVSSFTKFCF